MATPHYRRLIAASRDAFAWPAERPQRLARPCRGPFALGLFLFAASWFALVGVITTLSWLASGAAWLLKGAGL